MQRAVGDNCNSRPKCDVTPLRITAFCIVMEHAMCLETWIAIEFAYRIVVVILYQRIPIYLVKIVIYFITKIVHTGEGLPGR